jgi:hypothetical protein
MSPQNHVLSFGRDGNNLRVCIYFFSFLREYFSFSVYLGNCGTVKVKVYRICYLVKILSRAKHCYVGM